MAGSKPKKNSNIKWMVQDIMQSLIYIFLMKAIFIQQNLLSCVFVKSSNLIVLYNLVLLSRNIHEWRGRRELLSEGKGKGLVGGPWREWGRGVSKN